jgi:hypothetical protein
MTVLGGGIGGAAGESIEVPAVGMDIVDKTWVLGAEEEMMLKLESLLTFGAEFFTVADDLLQTC